MNNGVCCVLVMLEFMDVGLMDELEIMDKGNLDMLEIMDMESIDNGVDNSISVLDMIEIVDNGVNFDIVYSIYRDMFILVVIDNCVLEKLFKLVIMDNGVLDKLDIVDGVYNLLLDINLCSGICLMFSDIDESF